MGGLTREQATHLWAQVERLNTRIRPYLLRRTKGDVDLGLTPMEEVLISVDITNFQKRCYKAILERKNKENKSDKAKGKFTEQDVAMADVD